MTPNLGLGETGLRTLEQDDIDGICAAYPPGKLDPNCDPEPRHGFSTECSYDKGCCTVAPGRSNGRQSSRGALVVGLFMAGIAVGRRRRRTHASRTAARSRLELRASTSGRSGK